MTTETSPGPPLVRFGRRQSKGVLLGFSGIRLIAIGVALILFVFPMFTAGLGGVLFTAPLWGLPLASAFARWNGRPVIESAPMLAHWGARSVNKQTRQQVRASVPRPDGTMALPGDAAALRFHSDLVSGAAMIHDPHRNTLSAVVRVTHPAYVLLSPDDQARRVAAWSRVLGGLAASGTCAGVQILESTLPDPGHGVRGWFAQHGVHDESWATREYATLMEQAAPASSTHRTLIVLSLDMKSASKAIRDAGRGIAGAAEVLRGDIGNCEQALRSADLRTNGWLTAEELAVVVRQAYDPAAGDLTAANPGADLTTAGPVAVDEHWDYLHHDSAFSTVLWISEWPRIDVHPSFLHPLIFQQGVRKSISIIAKPLGTSEALRAIRKEKVEYITEQQQAAKIGKIADLSADQEYADVLARERALISGHADMRFSGFVAITANTRDELTAAVAATQRAANQCGCETRILYSQQGQAFTVAALPLGRAVN
jgi:hypothetical protein